MILSSSSVEKMFVEFTSAHGSYVPGPIPFSIAQGMLNGRSCFFFCIGDVSYQVHHCVGKRAECVVAVETLSRDDCSRCEPVTFYIVLQILSVR